MNITHLVTGPLSVNTWFLPFDERRMIVVDPGGDLKKIISHLSELQSVPALILLTHGHFDHLTALAPLRRSFPEIPIAIHPGDAFFLGPGAVERHHEFFTLLGAEAFVEKYAEPLPAADILLTEGEPIFGWDVLHTPGHSAGSICLYRRDLGVLVSGDTLFRDGIGRTDAPGGDYALLESSLERIFTLPGETQVLPGHGASTTVGREKN